MLRCGTGGAFCGAALLAAILVACVNPETDYKDWQGRLATVEQELPEASVTEGGVVEGGLDTAFSQQYVMACGTQLAQGDITKATYYLVSIKFTPTPGGAGLGNVALTDQALVLGATGITGSNLVGAAGTTYCTVGTDGTCGASFGPSVVPASADGYAINTEVDFSDSTLNLIMGSETQICAGLSGDVTSPIPTQLAASKNPCPFKVTTGQVPTFTNADLHCP
jgi:hypothetical protein